MEDLHNVGGTPAVLKRLLQANLIDGACLTCTTHTLSTNLEQCPELKEGQDVILPMDKPKKATGHLQILGGNLAPDGAVAKITGIEGEVFAGPALVFDRALLAEPLVPVIVGHRRTSGRPAAGPEAVPSREPCQHVSVTCPSRLQARRPCLTLSRPDPTTSAARSS